MEIGTFYVGAIPSRPVRFRVMESGGTPINVDETSFPDVNIRMKGSNNEEIDLGDGELVRSLPVEGEITFFWPPYSVFTHSGEYVLQLELVGAGGSVDYTSEATIYVKKLGGR